MRKDLPLLARRLSFARWSEERRLQVVVLAAIAYVILIGIVSVANLAIG